MQRIGTMIVMAVLLSAASGCGTMLNLDGKEKVDWGAFASREASYVPKYQRPTFPFGGVANDMAWINTAEQPIDVVFSLVDMPFSLVADVVTLPWVFYDSLIIVRPKTKRDEWREFWLESTSKAPPSDPAVPK